MTKKQLVLDTNVLLYDTECLDKFGNNDVVIPLTVVDELDSLKDDSKKPELSHASREITRKILDLAGEDNLQNLRNGFSYVNSKDETTTIKIVDEKYLKYKLDSEKNNALKYNRTPITNDDWIIFCAKILDATLITRDNNMVIKASGDCKVEIYYADSIKKKEIYKGYRELTVDSEFFNEFALNNRIVNIKELFDSNEKMYPNEFLILTNVENTSCKLFGICKGEFINRIDLDNLQYNGMKLRPQGLSQKLAFYLILQEDIDAISFVGGSGTGKTSIAIDYALNQVNKNFYNQLFYSKSMKGLADDEEYGFVPGDVDEKMQEIIIPLSCTLEFLETISKEKANKKKKDKDLLEKAISGEEILNYYKEDGIIRILPLNYLRGMTISNKVVVLDEGQNLTKSKMKTLVTRIASTSKLIITGDDNQIDDKNLNKYNNGLAHFIEQGKSEPFIAHLTLDLDDDSKRGRLSSFGNKL